MLVIICFLISSDMSKIFSIDPQTGNNYQGDEQTVTNVNKFLFFYMTKK